MHRLFLFLSALALLPGPVVGQTTEPADQQETIKALVKEVNELKARIAVLEAKQAQAQTAPAPEAAKPAEAVATQPAAQVPENAPFRIQQGIRFQGFGALTYRASDIKTPEAPFIGLKPGAQGNFAIGDVDLFLTSHLTNKMMVLGEVAFSEGDDQEFEIDLERLLLKYDANEYLNLSFGRFHTATSYYNSVFHHGNWLQTAVDRPLSVEFADHGGLLPSQAVGVTATGKVPSGSLGLHYILEYGTGDTVRPLINQPEPPEIDEENGNHVSGGLFIKPDWLPGLDIGGSFYHDRLNPEDLGLHILQTIGSAHAVYVTPKFELMSEGFLIRHEIQGTGTTFNTPAFYALVSRKFGNHVRPYIRYQYTNASPLEPLFFDVSLRHGPSAGVRLDLNDYLAFKAQYDRTYRRALPDFNQAMAQMAFRF